MIILSVTVDPVGRYLSSFNPRKLTDGVEGSCWNFRSSLSVPQRDTFLKIDVVLFNFFNLSQFHLMVYTDHETFPYRDWLLTYVSTSGLLPDYKDRVPGMYTMVACEHEGSANNVSQFLCQCDSVCSVYMMVSTRVWQDVSVCEIKVEQVPSGSSEPGG